MNTAVGTQTAEPLAIVETLAHELREPLSAIESTAYYLTMVLPRGETRAQEQASRLQRLIEQANWILSCALQMADASPLTLGPVNLNELVARTVASHIAEGGDPPQVEVAGELPPARLDRGRIKALLGSLLAMMTRAADSEHPVHIRTSREADPEAQGGAGVMLELALDFGMDARGQGPEACFGAGASLGIENARRIVEAHGGTFEIEFGRGQIEVGTTAFDAAGRARVSMVFLEASSA
jgi:light-regulated signal transduction histidine kinase (bacteriophytochrome)